MTVIHKNLSGREDHIIAWIMFVLSGRKKKHCVYTKLHLLREFNWRWVLVSELGQKNVYGPKDSWDITPTPWGWLELLCMSKTNHYICFYFMFCLWIEKREKMVASVKKIIALDLYSWTVSTITGERLVVRDKWNKRKRRNLDEHKFTKKALQNEEKSTICITCAHTHSLNTDG